MMFTPIFALFGVLMSAAAGVLLYFRRSQLRKTGLMRDTETMRLPFDPTTGFHEYRFDYSDNAVTFYVIGIEMRSWDAGIPQTSMHLMVNSWFPRRLEGRRPKKTAFTYVDFIGYQAPPAATVTPGGTP
jgi:beta-glucanase (GH16 family)